jgi:hypothetical protein
MLAGAAAATLLLSLALTAGRSAPIPFALLLLGAIYTIPRGDRAIPAPIYGSALLFTAELAYWTLDERVRQRAQAGVARPRLLAPSPPPRSPPAPSCSSQPSRPRAIAGAHRRRRRCDRSLCRAPNRADALRHRREHADIEHGARRATPPAPSLRAEERASPAATRALLQRTICSSESGSAACRREQCRCDCRAGPA